MMKNCLCANGNSYDAGTGFGSGLRCSALCLADGSSKVKTTPSMAPAMARQLGGNCTCQDGMSHNLPTKEACQTTCGLPNAGGVASFTPTRAVRGSCLCKDGTTQLVTGELACAARCVGHDGVVSYSDTALRGMMKKKNCQCHNGSRYATASATACDKKCQKSNGVKFFKSD
jgi:hypothetical protein